MTEKEKMLAGLLYDPCINLLAKERLYEQDICFELNQLLYSKSALMTFFYVNYFKLKQLTI